MITNSLRVRFADWLIRITVPRRQRDVIVGDLRERADQRLANGVLRRSASSQYVVSASSIALHFTVETGAHALRAFAAGVRRALNGKSLIKQVAGMFNDLRYSVRSLARRPGFTFVVIATLALGIGANTSIFTVVRNVVLRPVPYPESERLVSLWMEFRQDVDVAGFEIVASEPEYVEFVEASQSFKAVAGFWRTRINLSGSDEPIRIDAASVSANFFDVVGIAPSVGRPFLEGEDRPGAPRVAVITDGLWMRAFGRAPAVVGQSIVADGRSYQVVGVMPEGFVFPGGDVDFLRPNYLDPANLNGRSSHYLELLGRLRPGITPAQATAEAAVINFRMETAQPDLHGLSQSHPMVIANYQAKLTEPVLPALWVLTGAAGLVLLIACANVANLMFARSESRGHELAIRQALGASRGRLVRHTFAESLLLGTVGAGAGLWISTWVVPALASMGADHIPRTGAWHVDASVIGFAAMLALVTSVLFGLAPALSGSRSLQNLGDRGGSVSRTRVRVRNALLVTQMAVTVVLLIGAGVLTRNLMSLMKVDPGFDPDNVVTMTFALDVSRYESQASMADFHRRLGERIRALPAATDAGSIRSLPLATDGGFETISATGARLEADEHINTIYQVTSPGYFEALSVPIMNGRPLALTDVDGSEPVVVINQAMADRYWPDGRALGNRVQLGAFPENTNPEMLIVGIVGNVIHRGLGGDPTPQIFVPRAQAGAVYGGLGTRTSTLVVKGTAAPPVLIAQVRSVFNDLDPAIPLSNVQTMQSVVARSVSDERFMSTLLGVFSTVSLVLAAIGVYGLMSYLVVQRTREIGVRLALGATRRQVIGSVVGRSVFIALLGSGMGLVVAFAGSRVLDSFVTLVNVRDPWVYAVGPTVLLLAAMLAAYGPARRAANVDPMTAVRSE